MKDEQIDKTANSIAFFIVGLIVIMAKLCLLAFIGIQMFSFIHINIYEKITTAGHKNYELFITNDHPYIFTFLFIGFIALLGSTIGSLYVQQTSQSNT